MQLKKIFKKSEDFTLLIQENSLTLRLFFMKVDNDNMRERHLIILDRIEMPDPHLINRN